MKKFALPLFLLAMVAIIFTFCKKEEPVVEPDPNDVLTEKIATNSIYISRKPSVEYQFVFTAAQGDTVPATYIGFKKDEGSDNISMSGTWEVKNLALFMTKKEGFDFDNIDGCIIKNDAHELVLKSGSSVIHLYADPAGY